MDQMGKRIKNKREGFGFQINQWPNKNGATSSLISQIETGKAFPSIITLKKIAKTLQTKVGDLIENLRQHQLLESIESQFEKEKKNISSLNLLTFQDLSKQFEPYIFPFSKNMNSEGIITGNFPGHNFFSMLNGRFGKTVDYYSVQ